MPTPKLNLNTFADGALLERVNDSINKVLVNIADPNTDAKKKRSVTVTLTFEGNEQRNLANVSVESKEKLVPAHSVATSFLIDRDAAGEIVGAELKSGIPGQTMITEMGEVVTDTGELIDEVEQQNNIVDFRNSASK